MKRLECFYCLLFAAIASRRLLRRPSSTLILAKAYVQYYAVVRCVVCFLLRKHKKIEK